MWYAVILGGGSGQRMKAGKNKVLLDLCGIPILVRSLQAFQMLTDGMLVVMRREDMEEARRILDAWGFQNISIVEGGPTRQNSVYRGLLSLPRECDSVLIHDGARCLQRAFRRAEPGRAAPALLHAAQRAAQVLEERHVLLPEQLPPRRRPPAGVRLLREGGFDIRQPLHRMHGYARRRHDEGRRPRRDRLPEVRQGQVHLLA